MPENPRPVLNIPDGITVSGGTFVDVVLSLEGGALIEDCVFYNTTLKMNGALLNSNKIILRHNTFISSGMSARGE